MTTSTALEKIEEYLTDAEMHWRDFLAEAGDEDGIDTITYKVGLSQIRAIRLAVEGLMAASSMLDKGICSCKPVCDDAAFEWECAHKEIDDTLEKIAKEIEGV